MQTLLVYNLENELQGHVVRFEKGNRVLVKVNVKGSKYTGTKPVVSSMHIPQLKIIKE